MNADGECTYKLLWDISLKLWPLVLNDIIPCFHSRKMEDLILIGAGIVLRLDENIIGLEFCK